MRTIKLLLVFALLMPLSARACDVRPYARTYVKKIHAAIGGSKPKLLIVNGSSTGNVAFYNSKTRTIRIFKNDYPGNCSDNLPYLKSIISHEYAHHVSKDLKKVSKLKGEKLAYVGEHAIGDTIFGYGKVEYDNDKDLEHKKDYEKMKEFISKKKLGKSLAQSSGGIYFKKSGR